MLNVKFDKNYIWILLFSIWLTIPNILILTSNLNLILQEIVFLFIIFLYIFKFGFRILKISKINFIIFLVFLFIILFSMIFNIDRYNVLINFINFIIFYYCIAIFSEKHPELFLKSLKLYSLINLIILFLVVYLNYGSSLRGLIDGVQPNYIGLICLTVALSSIIFQNKIYTSLILLSSLYISYLVSSRTTMVCIVLITLFFIYNQLRKKIVNLFFSINLLIILLILNYDQLLSVISDYLMLDDSYRGLDSGFSGRSDRWAVAFNYIENNLFFGVGFKEGEKTLGYTTDNGYVSVLLELGIVGFIFYLTLFLSALWISFKFRNKNSYMKFNMITIFIFLIYCFFEQRYINFGNALSYIVFFSLFSVLNLNRSVKWQKYQ